MENRTQPATKTGIYVFGVYVGAGAGAGEDLAGESGRITDLWSTEQAALDRARRRSMERVGWSGHVTRYQLDRPDSRQWWARFDAGQLTQRWTDRPGR